MDTTSIGSDPIISTCLIVKASGEANHVVLGAVQIDKEGVPAWKSMQSKSKSTLLHHIHAAASVQCSAVQLRRCSISGEAALC